MIAPQRRREIVDALRRGTVPQRGLSAFAVGTERFADALDDDLRNVSAGGAGFKAIRGEYGSGKTFAVRWLAERARNMGFATAEVQIIGWAVAGEPGVRQDAVVNVGDRCGVIRC